MTQEVFHIPQTPTAFFHYQGSGITLSTGNATAWNIPADIITSIAALQTTYLAAYEKASNTATRSPANTQARDSAQSALYNALHGLYSNYLLNNDAIDEDDKVALHIHHTGGGGKPSPAPVTTPIVQPVSEGISQLYMVYADSATPNKHRKPAGVAFAEIVYKTGDPAPASPSDCPERFNATRSHEPIVFDPAQRGQTCYGFARWVNRNGKTGPWSSIFSEQIP